MAGDLMLDESERLPGDKRLPTENSIAEKVLWSLLEAGQDIHSHLFGDFALALWNQSQRRLVLARDHIGARPLYYSGNGLRLAFASDPRALLALPWVPCEIDERVIAQHLGLTPGSAGLALCRGIECLGPGQRLEWGDCKLEVSPWWQPEELPAQPPMRQEECVEQVRMLFDQAIDACLVPGAKIGAHCSGGLDSTAVALQAQHLLTNQGREFQALYSWSPEVSDTFPAGQQNDERAGLVELAQALEVPCRFTRVENADLTKLLDLDHHVHGLSGMYEELPVIAQARGDGVQVLLSGWGGDEFLTFNKRGYHVWLLTHGRLLRLIEQAPFSWRRPHRCFPALKWFGVRALLPMLPSSLRRRFARRNRQGPAPLWSEHLALTHADLLQLQGPFERALRSPRAWQLALLDSAHLAERMTCWSLWSAGSGLVHRYPLTDRRIVEFVLGLHPDNLYPEGRSRQLLVEALARHRFLRRDKADPVNERKRIHLLARMLDGLNRLRIGGALDGDCDWLDMERFRQTLGQVATDPQACRADQGVNLFRAAKVWTLWQRQQQGRLIDFCNSLEVAHGYGVD